MSKKVDERVVEMRFDNAQFESGVRTSMSTLERLKQSLNLKGASKGFENVNSAAQKVNLSGIDKAVDSLKVKFSALDVMAVTALSNITNSAISAGKHIASALFVAPPKDGLMEYETQINSTQTIMANTGENVETVNKALDELNEYADLTIYNFTEMTRNAGMFTAAGVKLPETMTALKGIGNWAAYAGANSSDMARATYQLGQALATGTIRLRDWVSIENTGGMAGKKYQEAFMETARQHGVAVDQIVAANGSFRDSLQEGWLTSDIFIETMQRFANDQSMTDAATKIKTFSQLIDTVKEALGTGWATTWRTIIGDFEEAKELWTSVNDVVGGAINKMSDARNKMLAEWKEMGGRDMLIESFKNAFEGIMSIVTPIQQAFTDIFPPITAQRLVDLTEKLENFTATFKISEDTANKIKSVFTGVFSLFDIGFQGVSALAKGFGELIGFAAPLGSGILDIAASIGDFITKIDESIKSVGLFDTVIEACK